MASETGVIWSIRQQKTLKPVVDTTGYKRVSLFIRSDSSKTHYVHRLVASAFIGPPPVECHVNHKDLNKLNNSASNLEYVTSDENVHHAFRNGAIWWRKFSDSQIEEMRAMQRSGARLIDIANAFGTSPTYACTLMTGKATRFKEESPAGTQSQNGKRHKRYS